MAQTRASRSLSSGSTIRLVARCAAIPLAAAALLLVGACGGDDDDKTSVTATSSSQATATEAAADATETPKETVEETPEGPDVDSDGSGLSTDIDACSLLKSAEAALALNDDVKEGERDDTPPFASCVWASTSTYSYVRVDVLKASSEELDSYYNISTDASPISGIGDKAHWSSIGDFFEVIDGDLDLMITLVSDRIEDEEASFQASGLAERALDRLP